MDRGDVRLNSDECKGCGLCVEACPPKLLHLATVMNRYGYHPATYAGHGCTGCGICYRAIQGEFLRVLGKEGACPQECEQKKRCKLHRDLFELAAATGLAPAFGS